MKYKSMQTSRKYFELFSFHFAKVIEVLCLFFFLKRNLGLLGCSSAYRGSIGPLSLSTLLNMCIYTGYLHVVIYITNVHTLSQTMRNSE